MHPSPPPPLPRWEAPPGAASPGRGLRRRSPRPGARERRARSTGPGFPGPAPHTDWPQPSAPRRPGGVAALSDVSTPRRAPPFGPGRAAELGSRQRGRGGEPLPVRRRGRRRPESSPAVRRTQDVWANTSGFFFSCFSLEAIFVTFGKIRCKGELEGK